MPTFPTPEPIHILLDIGAGDARIRAGDQPETTVDVVPRDASRRADVRAAEQTRVELSDGRLVVRTTRQGLSLGRGGVIDVTIAAPAGSRIDGHTGAGDLQADGAFGDVSYRSGAGQIRLGRAGAVKLAVGAGDISVQHAAGNARVSTGSGTVRVGDAERNATIKTANGDISVDHARADVVAKAANGHLRIGAAERGSLELSTARGNIDVGVAEGTAARLDVRTQFGHVDQQLHAADGPPASGEKLEVRGRTSFGTITIARAVAEAG